MGSLFCFGTLYLDVLPNTVTKRYCFVFLPSVVPSHHPVLSAILSKEVRFPLELYRLKILASSFGHLRLRWSAIHAAPVTLLHHVISLSSITPLVPGSSEIPRNLLRHCQLETPRHALIPLHIKYATIFSRILSPKFPLSRGIT